MARRWCRLLAVDTGGGESGPCMLGGCGRWGGPPPPMGLLGVRWMFSGTGLGLGLRGALHRFVGMDGELLLLLWGDARGLCAGAGESRDEVLLWSLPVELESIVDSITRTGALPDESH